MNTEFITRPVRAAVELPGKTWAKVRPVHVDGMLYFLIGVTGAMVLTFSSDAAYKYVDPNRLFWFKAMASWTLAGATALKTYRSTGYADSIKNKP